MQPHVVIVGGGFGGLETARKLAHAPVQITLLDRRNYHLFQPLLYQVATGALNPSDIAYPIRGALATQKNARVLLAEVETIDVVDRKIVTDGGDIHYDFLVLATGSTDSYFGHDDWEVRAPGMKSIEDAVEIRRRVYLAYEAAEREPDPAKQRAWLTFVVVGGGPTGVELAGAFGEVGLQTLVKDFRSIDPRSVRVVLCEGKGRVLMTYPPQLSEAAKRALERRHVDVRLDAMVTSVDADGVTVKTAGGSQSVAAKTVVWAAGVKASPLGAQLGAQLDRSGRVIVEADLSIPGSPEVFAIGDVAKMMSNGIEVPGVAQGAIQAGRHVAKIIAREAASPRSRRMPFHYKDKGSMATVGRAEAVIATKRVALHGLLAWLLWWVVHIYFLVGFRNRLVVMWSWAWSWITYKRGARLITGKVGALPAIAEASGSGPQRP
jgi:NADH dehydrogenase